MKIRAASLLLAFAGFLQESQCMFLRPGKCPALETGHIELTLENGDKLEGVLEMAQQEPYWLETEPLENFQIYEVLFHAAMLCNYHARLPFRPQKPGSHVPKSVKIRIENLAYLSYEGFIDSNRAEEIDFLSGLDHIYITMPGTKKIYLEVLESEPGFQNRMRMEREEREEREKERKDKEMREKRAGSPAGETSETRA